jgi:3-oxoacyl-[acyl-carrier protein] reductase
MGRAAAATFACEGSRIAIVARRQAELDLAVAALSDLGSPEVFGIVADLTDESQVKAAFEYVALRWGSINVLVNAAGPVDVGVARFEDLDDDEWFATFNIGTQCGQMGSSRASASAPGRLRSHRQHLGSLD